MSLLNDLGVEGSIPKVDLTGFVSNTWVWVAVVAIIGFVAIVIVGFLLFFNTYKKKVIIFENISGQGYMPIVKTRARVINLGIGGEEILKTLVGGKFLTAYGRKMGKNTFWFAKGQDGYLYNIILGDLDSKKAMLDIEPIDRDVRMFHVALDRLSNQTYGKNSFLEKYGIHIMLFVFLITLVLGMWFIVGKIGEATAPLAISQETSQQIMESNAQVTSKLEGIVNNLQRIQYPVTGIVKAPVNYTNSTPNT